METTHLRWPLARPDLPVDPTQYEPPAQPLASPGELRVTFLGVSSFVITDGTTTLITDGFISRPSKLRMLLGPVVPDEAAIRSALARVGVERADAVIVAHSHYDHAMDSPVVTRLTGAELVGSESTLQIGRGYGLTEDRLTPAKLDQTLQFGDFEISFVISAHAPKAHYPGLITRPLPPPARISAYRMAQCYSILIKHESQHRPALRILLHASAGYVPGALSGRVADIAYLGIGTLGKRGDAFRQRYWDETVVATGARRVVPIHWDDFTLPLDKPLVPFQYFADDFSRSWMFLRQRAEDEGRSLKLPTAWTTTDPRR